MGEPNKHTTAGSGASKPGAENTAEPEEVMMIEETWMQPYLAYMVNKTLPKDTIEARRIIRRSKAFVVLLESCTKKYNQRIAAMHHPSGRASHIKRHPRRSLQPSHQ
jgi:hypothetical protein